MRVDRFNRCLNLNYINKMNLSSVSLLQQAPGFPISPKLFGRLFLALVCFSVLSLVLLLVSFKTDTLLDLAWSKTKPENITHDNIVDMKQSEPARKRLVLFLGHYRWTGLTSHRLTSGCEVQNCDMSYDMNKLEASDAVVFRGRLPGNHTLQSLNKGTKNRALQRWVFFSHEPPRGNGEGLEGVFNWTMTYRIDSDIFTPYGSHYPYAKNETGKPVERNYTKGKTGLVAWMVSNCAAKTRIAIAQKLSQYIPVHVYGKCTRAFNQTRFANRKNGSEVYSIASKYKFYLAFENSACVGYITEKYWKNGLETGAVPVVFGGGDYHDKRLVIPGSFINVLDFPSIKDLADYIKALDKNDTAYNEYFNWKRYYHLGGRAKDRWSCQLCAMLNNASLPTKSYDNGAFQAHTSMEKNCELHKEKTKQLLS